MSQVRRARAHRAVVALVVLGSTTVAACGASSDSGDTDRFCSEIEENREALTSPTLATDDDVDALVDLYGDVGGHAPLAIEEDWDTLTELYGTASELEPGDAEAREELKELSFASEGAAVRVQQWVRENCDVNLGPVSTIVDHSPQLPASSTPPGSQP